MSIDSSPSSLSDQDFDMENNHSIIQAKKTLVDSTNNQFENAEQSLPIHRRQRLRRSYPLKFDTKRRNRLRGTNKIKIDNEILNDIECFQQGKLPFTIENEQLNIQQAKLRKSMYNARQILLTPFILNSDFPLLFEPSSQLSNILTLLNNLDEEYHFFEQFLI